MIKTVKSLDSLKKKFPIIHDELLEQFSNLKKKISNYEFDYLSLDEKTGEFSLSMSCGASNDLEIFDMSGEFLDDEIVVYHVGFEKPDDSILYDIDDNSRDSYLDSTEEHDADY